jgi:pyruvate formate lyase activating enzyme
LKEGQVGVCGVNKNEGGRLVNLVYGHPAALNVDPVEKKPLYHFLPGTRTLSLGTVGCNFKCPFCQNWTISQTKEVGRDYHLSPSQIVQLAREYKCKSIAYTYNEPTIFYPYARDIGLLAKREGFKNIFVTNGFESREVIEDMAEWVDGANVDLKSFDPGYYKKVLKGDLEGVLESIRLMKQMGIWVEITTLIVPGSNDSPEELRKIAQFIATLDPAIPWHISRFRPDYKETDKPATPMEKLMEAYKIGKEAGLKYIYLGNVTLPAITYCPNCGEELIVRYLFEVASNRLEKGKCPNCKTPIEGVWQ